MNQASKHGFIFGLLCPGDWRAKKEATMYSYNGVVLPKLPEWDKTAYPYAYLNHGQMFNGTKYIMFRVISKPFVVATNSSGTKIWSAEDAQWVSFSCDSGETAWSAGSEASGTPNGNENNSPVFWCNDDMKYADGTVYLPSSDPVPVYE